MRRGFGSIKGIVSAYIHTEEELNNFAVWAFGDLVNEYQKPEQFLKAWNTRHGSQLTLIPTNLIMKDVPKMVELWKLKK